MAYATVEEFYNFGSNSEALPDSEDFSDDVILQHLEMASSEIDAYLRAAYVLPLSSPYDYTLTKICIQLASYSIFSKRGFDLDNNYDQLINLNKTSAYSDLTKIAKGIIILSHKSDSVNNMLNKPTVIKRIKTSNPFYN